MLHIKATYVLNIIPQNVVIVLQVIKGYNTSIVYHSFIDKLNLTFATLIINNYIRGCDGDSVNVGPQTTTASLLQT